MNTSRFVRQLYVGISLCAILLISASCDDDPASSKKERPDPYVLPTARGSWTLSSCPGPAGPLEDRAKVLWHNPVGGVPADEIWDSWDPRSRDGVVNTLRLVFRPSSVNSWAGIMDRFAGIDTNQVHAFEMRVRGGHGRLHLDFGRINEDIDNDRHWDTEDGLNGMPPNEYLEEEEDVGLDGLPDHLEPGYDPTNNPDPNDDNWFCDGEGKCPFPPGGCQNPAFSDPDNPLYYEYLNGTEGNLRDLANLGTPDAEQLAKHLYNDVDACFSYMIDLAEQEWGTPYLQDLPNEFGWKTYRIYILDPFARDTAYSSQPGVYPGWAAFTHVRIWFDASNGVVQPDTVEIAEWGFVR